MDSGEWPIASHRSLAQARDRRLEGSVDRRRSVAYVRKLRT